MNFKKFIVGLGIVCLAAVLVFTWGCQNQPTGPGKKISSHMRAETCEKYGAISVNGGEYIIQNNVWGADTRQCIVSNGGTHFRVSVSEHNQGSVASYPSVFKGCHWGDCTENKGGGPVRVRDCSSAPFSFSVSSYRPSGDYNVAAEAWLNPSTDCSNGYDGGAEIMIVLDYHGMSPAGSKVGTFNGHDVYHTNIGWNFVTYVRTGRSSANGDMMDFINDAVSRGYVDRSWYIHVMEAGFEIMSGGQGLECNSFSFSMNSGGSTSTTTTTYSGGGGSNSIVVRARGTAGGEHIYLSVGDNTIGDWTLSSSYQNYSASTNNTGGSLVCFDNDDGENMDVQIDYITVNGSTRQAEDQTYNTGVWQDGECGGGDGRSEWLHCEGCIGFGDIGGGGGSTSTTTTSGGYTTTTTSGGGGGGSNSIVVRTRGVAGSEHIYVTVGGNQIADWTISTSYQNYSVSTNNSGDINVCFDNDDGENRDVQIDYIDVNGERREAEDQSYNTGVWQNDECGGGDGHSEWLHCEGCIGFGSVSGGGGGSTTTTNGGYTTTTAASTTTTSGSSWWGGGSWWSW
jgi:hypothetical protein